MLLAEIVMGSMISFIEPGTTANICAKVFHVAEGAGGVPTVWAIQNGSSRGIKVPAADVKPGCEAAAPAGPGGLKAVPSPVTGAPVPAKT